MSFFFLYSISSIKYLFIYEYLMVTLWIWYN